MARYKLENALRHTEAKEFESEEIAWNTLRKNFVREYFITLWKEAEIEVPINNENLYVERYNKIYGPQPIGYGAADAKIMKVGEKNIVKYWIPVLDGITTHPYNVKP